MTDKIFGDIPGHPEGAYFATRAELSRAGVHRPLQAGISGSGKEGANSIVLSGGYEDDQDFGDAVLYTGHGGRDAETRQQVRDQTLTLGNLALAHSCMQGLPVRVVRGTSHRSPFSPPFGYRYDGLYRVEDYWRETGKSEFQIWRFRLVKIGAKSAQLVVQEESVPYRAAPRKEARVLRLVRDTEQARRVKALHDFACQVCGVRLVGSAGPYAEAAHIRPLGWPHEGPDELSNLLCLCPNHHVLFDYGGLAINDDFSLLGADGFLRLHQKHAIDIAHVRYHREHYFPDPDAGSQRGVA